MGGYGQGPYGLFPYGETYHPTPSPFVPSQTVYLLDALGGIWQIGVNDDGIIVVTGVAAPSNPPFDAILMRDIVDRTNWLIVVTTGGILQKYAVSDPASQTYLVCISPSGTPYQIQVSSGLFITSFLPGCLSELIGTLYIPNFNNVSWTQPAGRGTVVFPQQRQDPWAEYPVAGQFFIEMSGLWAVGCGHSVDYPAIFRDFDPCSSKSVALIACPLCSFIQYGIEPFESAYDPISNAITII
jgi:hypothetical protein